MTAIAALCSVLLASPGLQSQQPAARHETDTPSSLGRQTYSGNCAGCHGLDARGTERAPNIATSTKLRSLTDAQIGNIISNGVPSAGMPAFRSLGPAQVRSIVAYLRSLQGEGDGRSSSGNPDRGKAIFFGKGGCSNCHSVAGQGGFLGPDLTYDSSISSKTILDGIVASNRIFRRGYRRAAMTTQSGEHVQGLVRNEDNFSIQLQDEEGAYHLLQKSELKNLEYLKEPLMPTDYGTRLTPSELDDVVSFLLHSGNSSPKPKPQKSEDAEWE